MGGTTITGKAMGAAARRVLRPPIPAPASSTAGAPGTAGLARLQFVGSCMSGTDRRLVARQLLDRAATSASSALGQIRLRIAGWFPGWRVRGTEWSVRRLRRLRRLRGLRGVASAVFPYSAVPSRPDTGPACRCPIECAAPRLAPMPWRRCRRPGRTRDGRCRLSSRRPLRSSERP